MSSFWKVCSFLCTQYLVGPPFAWITASMRRGMNYCINAAWHELLHQCSVAWITASMQRGMNYCINAAWHELLHQCSVAWFTASMRHGMEAISLWHCSGVMKTKVPLIAAFRSSALLGLVSLIFLLTIPHRFSMVFRSGEFAGQTSTGTP